jgi:hypothetical protein
MARKFYDWKAVQSLHDEGHGFVECSRRFGFSHTAWVKAIKRGTLSVRPSPFADRRRKYDWEQIQAFYDADNSYRETALKFGFCPEAWCDAIARGEIKSRTHVGMPISQLLVKARRSRSHVKKRLIQSGLRENRCQSCGLTEWRGRPLTIHLDHISGDKHDNRL